MEDMEDRRKRLAAMREQAASQEDDITVSSAPSLNALPLLCNPLEDSTDTAVTEGEVTRSQFDFYTDPLAGFQPSKRKHSGVGVLPKPSQGPQSNSSTPLAGQGMSLAPPPLHLPPANVGPPPGPFGWQPFPYQPPYPNQGFAYPQPPPQFYPQNPPHHANQFFNQPYGGQGPPREFGGRYGGWPAPIGPAGRGHLSGRGHPPSNFAVGRGYDSRSGSGGRGNSWGARSPSGDSWKDGNRSEGGRGAHGRGRGAGRIVSAKEQPHLFAKKSMMEDPWQGLEATDCGSERT